MNLLISLLVGLVVGVVLSQARRSGSQQDILVYGITGAVGGALSVLLLASLSLFIVQLIIVAVGAWFLIWIVRQLKLIKS